MRRESATVVSKLVPSSNGTSDVKRAGFPTPVVALHLCGDASAVNTWDDHANIGIGMSEGTAATLLAVQHRHNQSTSDANSRAQTTMAVGVTGPADITSMRWEGSVNALIDGGLEIDYTDTTTSGYQLTTLFQQGVSEATLDADYTVPNSSSAAYTGTLTFLPDIILVISNGLSGTANDTDAKLGFTVYDVAEDTYVSIHGYERDGQSTTDTISRSSATQALIHHQNSGGSSAISLSSVTSTGFTITRNSGSATSLEVQFMFIKLMPGYTLKQGFVDTPVSPNTRVALEKGSGYPVSSILLSSGTTAHNSNTNGMAISIGTVAPDGSQGCMSYYSEDDVTLSRAYHKMADDRCFDLTIPDATDLTATARTVSSSASLESFDASINALRLSFSTAASSVKLGYAIIERDNDAGVHKTNVRVNKMDARTLADQYSKGRAKVAEYEFRHHKFYQGGDTDG